jgi:hypothetical protein
MTESGPEPEPIVGALVEFYPDRFDPIGRRGPLPSVVEAIRRSGLTLRVFGNDGNGDRRKNVLGPARWQAAVAAYPSAYADDWPHWSWPNDKGALT